MPNQSNRRIITNRQLNFTLCPVDTYNKKIMPYRLPNYAIDGTWNHHQSIILDVLLHKIFTYLYTSHGNIPKSWRSEKVPILTSLLIEGAINPENLSYLNQSPIDAYCGYMNDDLIENLRKTYNVTPGADITDDSAFERYVNDHLDSDSGYQHYKEDMDVKIAAFNEDVLFKIDIFNLFKDYPFLIKYQYDLTKHIQKIEETAFLMNYKVKYIVIPPARNKIGKMTNRGRQDDIFYNMKEFQPIFSVDFDKKFFTVNFKSPLGKLILHNTLMLDTDWIPEEALELNKNAYFIYKRFILNSAAAKYKKKMIELWFNDVKSFLDLKSRNNTYIHKKVIDRSLEKMQQLGLIRGYEWNKHYKQKQYRVTI